MPRDYPDHWQAVTLVDPITGVPAGGSSSSSSIGQVGGFTNVVRVEKTRPNDTTAYSINDAVGNTTNWTFPVARVGGPGSGIIYAAIISQDDTASVNQFELDLYDSTITDIPDNVEATRLYTNIGKFLGTIIFPALVKKSTNSTQADASSGCAIGFEAVDLLNIYGVLRILNTDTPVAQSKLTITLFLGQD